MAGALEIARRALDELGFFSKALEEAKGAKMKSGTVQQWKNTLQKQGVKPAELDATGFSALPPDKPLSKDDLVDYLTQNRVQLGEKKLTSQPQEVPLDLAQRLNDAEMELLRLQDAGVRGQALTDAIRRYDQLENEMERFTVRNGAEAKYQQWSLPGGQNYQETLLKLPTPTDAAFGQGVRANSSAPTFGPHRNPHWDDPNVAVHYRSKERLGPNGERVLHIDEVQSDWGQQGAREGFYDVAAERRYREAQNRVGALQRAGEARRLEIESEVARELGIDAREGVGRGTQYWTLRDTRVQSDPQLRRINTELSEANRVYQTMPRPSPDGVPTAPFVTDEKAWTDLALKRAMIEAERGGYDALAFTRGAEQAERYNLSSRVGNIYYSPTTRDLHVLHRDGQTLHRGQYGPDDLAGVIGQENAQRLLEAPTNPSGFHALGNTDMVWGSKGMTRYYDQALPSRIDKLARSLDPEARLETMPAGRRMGIESSIDPVTGEPMPGARVYEQTDLGDAMRGNVGTFSREFPTYDEARAFVDANHYPHGQIPELNMLRLTPRMKEQIRQGLPLFVGAPVVAGGALSALEQPAPPANEFARGGPVRDQREQDRLRDIERASPSEEMLGDLVYRNYLPGYDLLAATRPIGGTDTVRLPKVQRFWGGGDVEAGQSIADSFNAGNAAVEGFGGWEGLSSAMSSPDYFGGGSGYGSGDGINWGDFFQQSQDLTNIANQVVSDPSYFDGGAEAGEPGFTGIAGDIMNQAGLGVPEAPYAGSPLGGLGIDFFSPTPIAEQRIDTAAAIPSADAFDPNFTAGGGTFGAPMGGTLADIASSTTFAGGTPAATSEMQREANRAAGLGAVTADVEFNGPEMQREQNRAAGFGNIEVPSRLPDGRMAAEYFGPAGNQTMRVNADLNSPYQAAAFQTALREMEERDMAALRDISRAREILSSRSQNTLTDEDRAIPVAGAPAPAPTQTAALDPMVMGVLDEVAGLPAPAPQLAGNASSRQAVYDMPADMVPISEMTPDRIARVLNTEIDPRGIRASMREFGLTEDQAMLYEARPIVESLINRRATTGVPIEQQLEQFRQYTSVPNNDARGQGLYPGDIDRMAPSPRYEQVVTDVLRDMSLGNRQYANAYNYANPSVRGVSEWVGPMGRQPGTVEVGVAPYSHYVGNVDRRSITPADLVGIDSLPPASGVSTDLTGRAVRGGRRADASEESYGLTDIARELFGIGTAQAAPVSAPAPQYDFGTVDRQDTMGMTGSSRRAGDALAAGLYNAGRAMRGMNEAPIVGSSGVAQSRGSAMTDTLGDSVVEPVEQGDISSERRATPQGTRIADVASDLPEPAPSTNRFSVDPLTGRMYDAVTGDRIINPNYVSRGIDFALGPTPVIGQVNGLLALGGGLTGYPLSAGQLMALGRPGTPLGNAGTGSGADAYGNYGSYGEGGADRLPPARETVAALPAVSGGGGGTLSTAAATPTSLSEFLRRRYLGEDEDPRTYGMRSQRRYYDYG